MLPTTKATLVGELGLIMWAVASGPLVFIKHLPISEILLFLFTISFIISVIALTVNDRWHSIRSQPAGLWIFNAVGICGSEWLFILASQHAPQADVNLINYLWPTFVILLAPLIPGENFQPKYLISALIAFTGILILLTDGKGLHAFDWQYRMGYLFAFMCALCWAVYTIAARGYQKQTPETVGLYCGLGALVIFLSQPSMDYFVEPTRLELGLMAYMGITSHNLAYMCWTYGVNQGNFRLLSLMTYFSPFISIGTLIIIGAAHHSSHLWTSVTLISFAGLFSALNWRRTMIRPIKT